MHQLHKWREAAERHWIVLLVITALLVSAIYGSVHVHRATALSSEAKTYDPLSLTAYYDETNVTGARAREILDGRWFVSDTDIYEHISSPAFLPIASPLFFAPLLFLTQSVPKTFIVADVVFSFIFFFIFYAIASQVFSGRRWPSYITALWLCLFPYIGLLLPPVSLAEAKALVRDLLPFQVGLSRDRLSLTLMESFIPDFLVFGSALFFFFRSVRVGRLRDFAILGVLTGILFYTYFYHWTFIFCSMSLLLLYALYRRNVQMRRGILVSLACALAVAVGYLIQYVALHQLPQFQEIIDRLWIEKGSAFRWSEWPYYLVVPLFLAAFWHIAKRPGTNESDRRIMLALSVFLVTGVLALNVQVVTGFNVQPSHWMPRTNVLAVDLAVAFLLYAFFRSLRTAHIRTFITCAVVLLTVFQVVGGFHSQYVYGKAFAQSMTLEPWRKKSFDWLEHNISNDAVVVSPSLVTNYFLPVYTPARIYLPRANNSVASNEEMLNRLVITYALYGVPENRARDIFDTEENRRTWHKSSESLDDYERRGLLYFFSAAALDSSVDAYREQSEYRLPEAARAHLESLLGGRARSFDAEQLLRYRMDYLYVGPTERDMSHTDFSTLPFLERVYDADGVEIYHVSSSVH